METLNVPSVNGSDPIELAIRLMNKSQSPAVVVVLDNVKTLYTSRYVFRGYGYGLEYCNQLDKEKGFRIIDTENIDTAQFGLSDSSDNDVFGDALKAWMDRKDSKFAVVSSATEPPAERLSVVARNSDYLQQISGQHIICVCSGPSRHLVEGTNGLDGTACKICGKPYICTTSI